MSISSHFEKGGINVPAGASAQQAAGIMQGAGTGCLLVLEDDGRPMGVVTDRDLTLRVAAEGRDPAGTRVEEIMTSPAVTVPSDSTVEEVLLQMRKYGVRRLPVVRDDKVVGMISFDDLLVALSLELADLGETIRRELWRGAGGSDVQTILRDMTGSTEWTHHTRKGL